MDQDYDDTDAEGLAAMGCSSCSQMFKHVQNVKGALVAQERMTARHYDDLLNEREKLDETRGRLVKAAADTSKWRDACFTTELKVQKLEKELESHKEALEMALNQINLWPCQLAGFSEDRLNSVMANIRSVADGTKRGS